MRHPDAAVLKTFQDASANLHSSLPSRSGPGIALCSCWKPGPMPEELFYLLIIFSVVTGLLLIRIVRARSSRRRKGRRLEREIVKHFRKRAAGQNN